MRFIIVLAFLFLAAFQKGSTFRITTEAKFSLDTPLADHARNLYQQGDYFRAEEQYQLLTQKYLLKGDIPAAISSLNNAAGCMLASQSYKRAAETYLQARILSHRIRHIKLQHIIDANLALIYGLMGDHRKTITLAEKILPDAEPHHQIAAPLYLYLGNASHQLNQRKKSHQYFLKAAEIADHAGDTPGHAMALDHLGLSYLDQDNAEAALPYIYEAFRIRKFHVQNDLFLSYRSIGRLHSLLNQHGSAERSLSRVIHHLEEKPGRTPLHAVYTERAKVREKLGNFTGAYSDYRRAFQNFRKNRPEFYTEGELSATAETTHESLRSAFISFSSRQYLRRQNPAIALESFIAVEESRFISLLRQKGHILTPENRAFSQNVEHSSPLFQTQSLQPERSPVQKSGLTPEAVSRSILQKMQKIPANEAIFSFYLSQPESYLWILTSGKIHFQRCPSKEIIREFVQKFRQQLLKNDPHIDATSREIYSILFQEIPSHILQKQVWTIIPDSFLFDLPFSALQSERHSSEYLIQKHLIRLQPGFLPVSTRTARTLNPSFVGFGDAVYNLADTRLSPKAMLPGKKPSFELPRLFNSGEEVRKCANIWGKNSITHTGEAVTLKAIFESQHQTPDILHIAAHLIPSKEDESRMLLSLGYDVSTGNFQLIDSTHISSTHRAVDLVVLSGCHSGNGYQLPGVGLLGLTRSWLISGASQVAATYWQIPDNTDEFFVRFYTHYQKALNQNIDYPADYALRWTQVEMLQKDSWQRSLRFWSSFFILSGS